MKKAIDIVVGYQLFSTELLNGTSIGKSKTNIILPNEETKYLNLLNFTYLNIDE